MDKRDWEFLNILYQTKNISKAAEILYISQPALTNRIQKLEKEFNIQILYRIKRGIEFTIEGEHLVNYSRQMLADYQKTKLHLLNLNNEKGYIKLGVNNHYALYKLTDVLKTFMKTHPKIQIKIKTGISSFVMKYLYDEEVHVAIESGEFQWSDKKSIICKEDICLISNTPIDLDDLPERPMIKFKTNRVLQKRIDDWWKERFNKPPSILMEMDSAETCKKMVQHDFGYAIVPGFCLTNNKNLYAEPLKMKDGSIFTRDIWMKYSSASLDLNAVEKFVAFMETNQHP